MPPRVRLGETASPELQAAAGAAKAIGPAQPPAEETFSFILPSGDQVIVGKPRGVLKLKMRDILTDEQFKDPEIKEIARALLSIKSVGSMPVFMRTPEHFEALLNRFGSDERVDEFMGEWQKFVNPVMYSVVERALQEALDKGLTASAVEEYIAEAVTAEARKTLDKVKT
jgi:hypothetical protein